MSHELSESSSGPKNLSSLPFSEREGGEGNDQANDHDSVCQQIGSDVNFADTASLLQAHEFLKHQSQSKTFKQDLEQKGFLQKKPWLMPWISKNRSLVILLALALFLTFLTEGTFLTSRNLTNLTRQVAINGILAVGMTYVILVRGIDLSVGSVVALTGVIAGLLQVNLGLSSWGVLAAHGDASGNLNFSLSAWLASGLCLAAAMGTGAASGLFNGWMITRYQIAPFIVTLGMMVIARGLALILAGGAAIAPLGEHFNALGQGYLSPSVSSLLILASAAGLLLTVLRSSNKNRAKWMQAGAVLGVSSIALWAFSGYRGLPIPVLIFAILGLSGAVILQKTRLGRYVLAMGGNPEAAWLAGVPVKGINLGIYVAMGVLAGLSGAILSARLNGSLPTAGELFELDAIAAVVIGGTSLMGGVGTVRGSILGAFFIGMLNNGMSLLDVTEFYQKIIKGVIIILAVWMDMRNATQQRS